MCQDNILEMGRKRRRLTYDEKLIFQDGDDCA